SVLTLRGIDAYHLGKSYAFIEVIDMQFAIGALVAALDDHTGAAATVGIFHLRLHAGAAKIEFGTYACLAQVRYHPLVATEAFDVLVHDQHHHRCFGLNRLQLAKVLQRSHQARDADREAGCRDGCALEARHKPVIAAATADRTKAHDLAILIRDLGQQLGFEHGAGVIFQAAHDRRVDLDATVIIAGGRAKSLAVP